MEKIRIVYNEVTKKIVSHGFNKDGTVFITATGIDNNDFDNIIVSMVDVNRVDFVHGYILEEGECVKEEEGS